MSDQEALNRQFSECLATTTTSLEHCTIEIKELKQEVLDASSGINHKLNTQSVQLGRIESKLEAMEKIEDAMYGRGERAGLLARTQRLEQLQKDGDGVFVTKIEFDPIKKLVYGGVGLVVISVIVALLSLVVHK